MKEVASFGNPWQVDYEDRSTGGVRYTALRVDQADGLVHVGQAAATAPDGVARGAVVDAPMALAVGQQFAVNRGIIPGSRVAFSVQPTAGNTLGIGATTIQYVAALGAAGANAQVLIGASAAATLANTIAYVNGTSGAGTTYVESNTAPLTSPLLFADAPTATTLRIRLALSRGGSVFPGIAPSAALTATITGGAAAWQNANLNETGKKETDTNEASGIITLTAAMIAQLATGVFFELPFTPTVWSWEIITAAGAGKWTVTDTLVISGSALVLTSAGAVHVVAGDQLSFWVQQ